VRSRRPSLLALIASLSACAAPAKLAPSRPATLAFREDDYAAARAEALARKVPLFVDSWAYW